MEVQRVGHNQLTKLDSKIGISTQIYFIPTASLIQCLSGGLQHSGTDIDSHVAQSEQYVCFRSDVVVDAFMIVVSYHGYPTWGIRARQYAEWRVKYADNEYGLVIFDYEIGTFALLNSLVHQTTQITIVLIICMTIVTAIYIYGF